MYYINREYIYSFVSIEVGKIMQEHEGAIELLFTRNYATLHASRDNAV